MKKVNYKKIYEEYYGVKVLKGMHIHHKDMNHENNDPLNLEMLTPDEHAQKHGFLNNFIMAQARACDLAVQRLKQPDMREKMRAAMENSQAHKDAIKKRGENPQWQEKQAEVCRSIVEKRSKNEDWKRKVKEHCRSIAQRPWSQERKAEHAKERGMRKWYNDGVKAYHLLPEQVGPQHQPGRKIK